MRARSSVVHTDERRRLPRGEGNQVWVEGPAHDIVAKRYAGPDAELRQGAESTCLRALYGALPVPEVMSERPGVLRMRLMPGAHGQQLLAEGQALTVMRVAGTLLRRLHEFDLRDPHLPGEGPAFVHGDFGPQNLLIEDGHVAGLLDWELAHRGERVEDVAWAEWTVRLHHPDAVAALEVFFTAYGTTPPWPARQAAMLQTCRSHLERAHDAAVVDMWLGRMEVTRSWAPLPWE